MKVFFRPLVLESPHQENPICPGENRRLVVNCSIFTKMFSVSFTSIVIKGTNTDKRRTATRYAPLNTNIFSLNRQHL